MNLYVIAESEAGPCKVGFATEVGHRLSNLQSGNHRELRVFYQEMCIRCRTAERIAHSALWRHRRMREWFDVPVTEAIRAVQEACARVGRRNHPSPAPEAEFPEAVAVALLDERAPR